MAYDQCPRCKQSSNQLNASHSQYECKRSLLMQRMMAEGTQRQLLEKTATSEANLEHIARCLKEIATEELESLAKAG